MRSLSGADFRKIRLGAAVLVGVLVLTLNASPAHGDPGIAISTPFPGVSARPGETVRLSIRVANSGPDRRIVDVSVKSAPRGWNPILLAQGYAIHQVLLSGNESQFVELEFTVPEDVADERNRIVVEARGGGEVSTLPIEVKVSSSGGSSRLIADYPELRGPNTAEFRFRLTLSNDASSDQMYSLIVSAPTGWNVKLTPAYSDQQIASLSLKPGASQALEVAARPPKQVEAGTYPLVVRATSGRGVAEAALKITITGSYGAVVGTPSERLNASVVAGRDNRVAIVVKNTGTAPLHNLQMSADKPTNWHVAFEPDTIDNLAPGESKQVTAVIRPDARSIAGDYVVGVGVNNQEVYERADLRVMVRKSTAWGVVGALILVGVVMWQLHLFRTYGRR